MTVSGVGFQLDRTMITANPSSGDPVSLWLDDGGSPGDEGFKLIDNRILTAYEVADPITVNNIGFLGDAQGFAWNNDGGNATEAPLFIPVTGDDPVRDMGPGWSLLTVLADLSDPGALDAAVTAIIKVGRQSNGDARQAATWFRNEPDNSLGALEAGEAYFIFFDEAVTDFEFGL